MVDVIVILLVVLALLTVPRNRPASFGRADKAALERYDERARGQASYPYEARRR
jgi:hypothetical protein